MCDLWPFHGPLMAPRKPQAAMSIVPRCVARTTEEKIGAVSRARLVFYAAMPGTPGPPARGPSCQYCRAGSTLGSAFRPLFSALASESVHVPFAAARYAAWRIVRPVPYSAGSRFGRSGCVRDSLDAPGVLSAQFRVPTAQCRVRWSFGVPLGCGHCSRAVARIGKFKVERRTRPGVPAGGGWATTAPRHPRRNHA
jgi:hypothetical protein